MSKACCEGVEEYLTTIMTYYGVTALSFRNAMYHLVRQDEELFRRIWINEKEFHPTCAGTRCSPALPL